MVETILKVEGMHCPKCVQRVEKAVGALAGVESVKADFEADTCVIVYDGSDEVIPAAKAAITELDFTVAD